MFPTSPNAEIVKRSLEDDDAAGLCCLYGTDTPVLLPGGTCESALGAGLATAEPSTQCPGNTLPQFFLGSWTCSGTSCAAGWVPAWNGVVFTCVPGECSAATPPPESGCEARARALSAPLIPLLLLLAWIPIRRRASLS